MKEKDNLEDKIKRQFEENKLLTVKEVAELLRVNYYTVYRWVKRGELSAAMILNKLRFDITSIEQYLKKPKYLKKTKMIEKSPKVLRSIFFDIEQVERLKKLSAKTRVPQAVYVRDAIDLVLNKHSEKRRKKKGKQAVKHNKSTSLRLLKK